MGVVLVARYQKEYFDALARAVDQYRLGDDSLERVLRVELGQDPAVAVSPVGIMAGWARLYAEVPDFLEGEPFPVAVIGPDEKTRAAALGELWWARTDGVGKPRVMVVVAPAGGWSPEHVPVIESARASGVPVVVTTPHPGVVPPECVPEAVAAVALTRLAREPSVGERMLRVRFTKMRGVLRDEPRYALRFAEDLGVGVPGIRRRFVFMWVEMGVFSVMSAVVAYVAGAPPAVFVLMVCAFVWRGLKLRRRQVAVYERELAAAVDRYLRRRLEGKPWMTL